jgi:hypothetical protein
MLHQQAEIQAGGAAADADDVHGRLQWKTGVLFENSLRFKENASKKRENPDRSRPCRAHNGQCLFQIQESSPCFTSSSHGSRAMLIMLEVNGRQVAGNPSARIRARPGIIEAADAPAAIHALEAAVAKEETDRQAADRRGGRPRRSLRRRFEGISLRQRVRCR